MSGNTRQTDPSPKGEEGSDWASGQLLPEPPSESWSEPPAPVLAPALAVSPDFVVPDELFVPVFDTVVSVDPFVSSVPFLVSSDPVVVSSLAAVAPSLDPDFSSLVPDFWSFVAAVLLAVAAPSCVSGPPRADSNDKE